MSFEFDITTIREAVAAKTTHADHSPTCDHLVGQYQEFEKSAREAGEIQLANAFWFLGSVCTMMLTPGNEESPYSPSFRFQNGRSPIVDDFEDQHLEVAFEALSEVGDSDLRGRIGDVIWIRLRKHEAARVAVDSFLETADLILESPVASDVFNRLERALQLASTLGRKQDLFVTVVNKIESLVTEDQTNFDVARAMDLLLDANASDALNFAEIAMKRASEKEPDANDGGVWPIRFYGLASRFFSRGKNEEKSNIATQRIAETYEAIADQRASGGVPGKIVATGWLEKAIQVLRRVPSTESERDRIHKKLLALQKIAVKELPRHVTKLDLEDCRASATKPLKGKTLAESIQALAFAMPVPSKSKLLKNSEETLGKSVLPHIFPTVKLGSDGKVVHKSVRMTEHDATAATTLHAYEMFGLEIRVLVSGVIEAMRSQIMSDFYIKIEDLQPYYEFNAFVPPGREWFFAKGLYAGFTGDFATALHLLIPQIENSLRVILNERGIATSSLDPDGIQNEYNLNQLLYGELGNEVETILGEDNLFALRALLVERCTFNLRNRLAHGMLQPEHLFDIPGIYTWWLVLHICACGINS